MNQQHYPELKVHGVTSPMHECYKNIAARTGITLSKVLAPKISAIVKKYEHLLDAKPCAASGSFVIRGVSDATSLKLDTIAAMLGVDRSDLVKMELNADLSTYSDAMKTKMPIL